MSRVFVIAGQSYRDAGYVASAPGGTAIGAVDVCSARVLVRKGRMPLQAETPAERHQEFMYGLIETVLRDIGARESCSENERRLGRYLVELWKSFGLAVHTERFQCHPTAFLGFIPFSSLLYLAATIAYWWLPFVCFVLATAAFAMTWFELLRYRECVDALFPAAEGENVVGVFRPSGEVQRRVVVSAHQDSAYEFTLWYFLRDAAIPIMVIAFAAPLIPALGGLARSLAGHAADARMFAVIGDVCLALYPFVGLNLFFHTYWVVPGAMDNLAGISVITGLGKALADSAHTDAPLVHRTEVVLLATSSEEAGLRGAKRYAASHLTELQAAPTFGIFVDGIYDERFLTVFKRELFTGASHDRRLVELAQRTAASHGWPLLTTTLPVGSTDAAAFTLAGVPAVSLICQETRRLAPNYHTRRDVIDHVRPQSLTVMLQMVIDMIQHIDAMP